jgi:hypothetical protein
MTGHEREIDLTSLSPTKGGGERPTIGWASEGTVIAKPELP